MISSLDRTLGFYPISIATSMALEGVTHTGEYMTREGDPPIKTMECLYVNLRTLIRNAIGGFTSEQFNYLQGKALIEAVVSDWHTLREYVLQHAPHCEVKLYLCEYASLDKEFPNSLFKQSETPKQVLYESLERNVMCHFVDKLPTELMKFDTELEGDRRTVVLTHLPLDLLSYYNFPDLTLLESHTGVLKERRAWASKLQVDKTVTVLPFNKVTIAIFGDKVMFRPQDLKIRRIMIKIGEKRGWNSLTTVRKMLEDIQLEHEPFLLEFVRRYK